MAITLLVGVVPLTVESGQTVFLTPSSQIQVVVDGVVIDPSTITVNVTPPDATLTLPDGQVVTLAGFVDETGEAGGGLVDADGELVVASTLEGLTQAAAGPAPTPAPSPEALEPGAGGQAGGPGGVDAGGSSIAVVTYFEDGFGNIFGISPSGEFVSLALPPLDVVPFEELPLLLEDEILALVAEAIVGEFLLFTDSLVPGFEGLTNPTSPDDFAFFNNPSAPLFSGGTLNLAFDNVSGSSGVPFDLNITNSMNGNDTVELADAGNPNGNNLKELFGVPTAFYGGTGDDTLTGGTDHDIIVGDGQQAGNSVMDCGDEGKEHKDGDYEIESANGRGGKHGHHDPLVVIKGDDDSLFGGDGDDVLLGDGLLSKPGYDPQSNIGFPNLVDPAGPPGGPIDPSMEMPANLLHNFVVGMFGLHGKKEVLNIEVEKQADVKLAGGDDSLFGGEGDDLAVGDALIIVEGRSGRHENGEFEERDIETQGIGGGGHGHGGRPDIRIKGGDDTIEGNEGKDKLIGDGIARLPSELFGNPHGGHGERGDDFEHLGLRDTSARLEGGDDTLLGQDGNDVMIGDGIVNVTAQPRIGKGMKPYGGDCSPYGGDCSPCSVSHKGGKLSAKIAVFDNEDFVDTEPSGTGVPPQNIEADEVQASLDYLGHKVRPFEGITAEDIEHAIKGKDVLLIPEMENGNLAAALSSEALEVIRDFIMAGGRVVVHGDAPFGGAGQHAANLINALLGTSVTQATSEGTSLRTAEAKFTAFEKGPDFLEDLGSQGLSGLPTDGSATSLYEGPGGLSTVAQFELGHGSITYIGEDWFNFSPFPGGQPGDYEWNEVLDIAVSPDPAGIYGGHDTLIGGDGADKMAGDGLINVAIDDHRGDPYGGEPYGGTCPAAKVSGGEGGGREGGGKTLIQGGHDLMYGDSVADGTGVMKVAVWFDPEFFGTDPSSNPFPANEEAAEILASLQEQGHNILTFEGISATAIAEALEGADVFVIPEQDEDSASSSPLVSTLTEEALDVIREFVRDGGKLIVSPRAAQTTTFLNELFDYELGTSGFGAPATLTEGAAGTAFEGGPASIGNNNQANSLTNLPDNAIGIYERPDESSAVVLFQEGFGQVVYLGWDWANALPAPGDQDDGWLEVLRRAVEMDAGGNNDVMLGDGILNVSLGGKNFRSSDDVQVSGGEGGSRKGGKTVLKGGDDEMHGGLGDDKMVGDAILNAHAGGLLPLGFDGHGDGAWSNHDFWFDKELLFGDLTRKDKGKYGKGKPGDEKPSDAKLFGGNDWMFGGQGDDWMRGDGLWEIGDEVGRDVMFTTSDRGDYGHGDHGPRLTLQEARKAKGGHDVMFGGADEDKMWGEGGHDFIVGDGFTTGLDQEIRDFGTALVTSLTSGEGGGLVPPELLDELFGLAEILEGFQDIEGGLLVGYDDMLFGGDDDRGTFGKFVGNDIDSSGENGRGHHDDLPIWAREFGVDDIILGDGLVGLTHDLGAFVPLIEALLSEVPELVELIEFLLPGIDVEEVLAFFEADEPLRDFTGLGSHDYIEGNSGRDLLAGDFITWLNIVPTTGIFKAPPSPSPDPMFETQNDIDSYAATAFMRGGNDVMFGDSPNDHKKRHHRKDRDEKVKDGADSEWLGGGEWGGDHEVSYDDLMFGDLLLGVDAGALLGFFALIEPDVAPAAEIGSGVIVEALGGDDEMTGGRGEDVIYGDGIILGIGEGLFEFLDEFLGGFIFGTDLSANPLAAFSALSSIEPALVEGFGLVSASGGNDTIWGDDAKDHEKGHHKHHHDHDNDINPDFEAAGGEGGERSYDDNIIGDGIFAAGGIQKLFGGFDSIWAGKGDDVVLGDGINSFAGKDVTIIAGSDFVDGGKGNDLIYGDLILDSNTDFVTDLDPFDAASWAESRIQADIGLGGGTYRGGNDTLQGGKGNDTVYGEGGDDTVDGGKDIDIVFGGVGSDLGIWGDPWAEAGTNSGGIALPDVGNDDTIDANVGEKDYYDGNFGNFDGSSFTVNRTAGRDDPGEPLSGSSNNQIDFDTLLFALSEKQLDNADLLAELKAYQDLLAGAGGDIREFEFDEIPLVAVEWEDVDFALFWCEDHVAQDIRFGDGSSNKIVGGKVVPGAAEMLDAEELFNNMILGLGDDDFLVGDEAGEGGGIGDDILLGQDGDDTLLGDANDGLGRAGDSGLQGGDDKLIGGANNDTLIGDTGDDRGSALGSGDMFGTPAEMPRGGDDKLFGDFFDPYLANGASGGADELYGDAFDELAGALGGNDLLVGGADGDTLFGDAGTRVQGSGAVGGNDTLYGDGQDIFSPGGADTMFGDAGGGLFNPALGGNDTLVGGTGGDTMSGDAGDDLDKSADGGDDLLVGDFDAELDLMSGGRRSNVNSAWGDDDLVGGGDTLFGDALDNFGAGQFAGNTNLGEPTTKGGNDTLIGDSRVNATLDLGYGHGYGEGDRDLPSAPRASGDTISGDAGGDIGDPSRNSGLDPVEEGEAAVGGDDELFGDNVVTISLTSSSYGKHGLDLHDLQSKKLGGFEGFLTSAGDTMAGDALEDMIGNEVEPEGSPETSFDVTIVMAEGGNDLLVGDTVLTLSGASGDDDLHDDHHGGHGGGWDNWFGGSSDTFIDPSFLEEHFSAGDEMAGDALGEMFLSKGGNDTLYGDNRIVLEDLGKLEHGIKWDLMELLDYFDVSTRGKGIYGKPTVDELLEMLLDEVGGGDFMYGDSGDGMRDGSIGGDDSLYGQGGGDSMAGDTGGPLIDSSGGNDVLFGGGGGDRITGGAFAGMQEGASDGDDTVFGGRGEDDITGDTASTMLSGSSGGNDSLFGGDGDDQVVGDAIDIREESTAGNDMIYGGDGDDRLAGDGSGFADGGATLGDDSIHGGDGDDLIFGDVAVDFGGERGDDGESNLAKSGDDILDGGAGSDSVYGGGGDDLGIWRGADHTYGSADLYDGGGNNSGMDADTDGGDAMDTLRLILTAEQFDDPEVWDEILALQAQISFGDDDLIFNFFDLDGDPNDVDLTVIEWEKIEVVLEGCEKEIGQEGSVFPIDPSDAGLFGGPGFTKDLFRGFRGVDEFFNGLDGNDALVGDARGDDALELSDDVLVGGLDNDIVLGDANADLVGETGGNDKLFGGEGSDTVVGDTGVGVMLEGEEPMTGLAADIGGVPGTNILGGGRGGDDLINGGPNAGRRGNGEEFNTNYLFGDAYGDIQENSSGGNDSIDGGAGRDNIFGDAGRNIGGSLELSTPNTEIIIADDHETPGNRGGDDRIAGDAQQDIITGDAGGDIIGETETSSGGDDFIVGGKLTVVEGEFDGLIGEENDDSLESDHDRIDGDASGSIFGEGASGGDDVIYGDSYTLFTSGKTIGMFEESGGEDTINGDARFDLADGAHGGDDLIFGQGNTDEISGDAGGKIVGELTEAGDDTISGGSDNDEIWGDSANEIVDALAGNDVIAGDNLSLYSSSGRPVIRGRPGDDGKVGNDIISGDSRGFLSGRGGHDLLVGDSLAIVGFAALYGDAIYDSVDEAWNYGFGAKIPISDDAGSDQIAGDSLGGPITGVAGDDVIFGDNYVHYPDSEHWGDIFDEIGDNDTLWGDAGVDDVEEGPRIFGRLTDGGQGGDDIIHGQGGGDQVIGDTGGDIEGEGTRAGNDELYGGGDNDLVVGDTHSTLKDGAVAGNDTLFGGDAGDFMVGDAFNEIRDATAGDDWLFGGDGDDELIGDSRTHNFLTAKGVTPDGSILGNDDLWGEEGDDVLIGDIGEAVLSSADTDFPPFLISELGGFIGIRGGDDLLYGGKGNDALVGDTTGEIRDFIPEEGSSASRTDGRGGDDTLAGGKGNDLLVGDVGGGETANLDDGAEGGDDQLFGDEGDDRLIGDAQDDIQDGAKGGNDTLDGGSGDDDLIGDANGNLEDGNFDIPGEGGDDLLMGGSGYDTLIGDAGNDVREGSSGGDDTLKGGTGDDTLIGDAEDDVQEDSTGGNDTLFGGDGHDTLVGDAGRDVGDVNNTLLADGPDGTVGGNDSLFGGKGDDTLYGDAHDELDEGGIGGDDLLDGGKGNDLLVGDAGGDVDSAFENDFEDGGEGSAFVGGSTAGDDILLGGYGDDTLIGDAGGDIVEGSMAGDDTLLGGEGNDILIGDAEGDVFGIAGNDTLTGDGGEDTFVVNAANNGTDIITDLTGASGDDDILRITNVLDFGAGDTTAAALDAAGVTVTDDGTDVTVTFGGTGGSVVIQGIGTGAIDSVVDLGGAIELEITA